MDARTQAMFAEATFCMQQEVTQLFNRCVNLRGELEAAQGELAKAQAEIAELKKPKDGNITELKPTGRIPGEQA